jgi:mannose-6-phosphate isomerase-like protein (cupin superfamily)
MENLRSFIESGILESYVCGSSTSQENGLVEEMASRFDEVRAELDSISEAFEFYALAHAVPPEPTVKTFLMATVDYTERLQKGEAPSFPPELTENSLISEFVEWLTRPDMVVPEHWEHSHAKIIGYQPGLITAIVWISDRSTEEIHEAEHEKFLIVEGTCDIVVGQESRALNPGDYFAIPLYKTHQVIVTSNIPCKVILQRKAA